MHPVKNVISSTGIYAACTSNDFALSAVFKRAAETQSPAFIAATSNAVNQYGGYSGLRPADFAAYVRDLAWDYELDEGAIILGADHLGPLPWREAGADYAMSEAAELVKSLVNAGFTVLHIDTTTKLLDDKELTLKTAAKRSAALVAAAVRERGDGSLAFVLGGRMPGLSAGEVSTPEEFGEFYRAYKEAFENAGIGGEFENVLAFVASPGVGYGDFEVERYDGARLKPLSGALSSYGLYLEAHSTDYQSREDLRAMAGDGVRILKVGPALTYRLKEALYSLSRIEDELAVVYGFERSGFPEVLEGVMIKNPKHYAAYYKGGDMGKKIRESLLDRSRYYLSNAAVENAVQELLLNLNGVDIPQELIKQWLPGIYERVASGQIAKKAFEMILSYIGDVVDDYLYATGVEAV